MKYIIGNWKMNPPTLQEAISIFKEITEELEKINLNELETIICPPIVWLCELKKITSKIKLGSQDVFYEERGTFTGQISPLMLKDFGINFSLVGHSEKRRFGNESSEIINKKLKACLNFDITPIYIFGDLKAQSIEEEDFDIMANQLQNELFGILSDQLKNILFVYEPTFAISKGLKKGKAVPLNHAVKVISFFKNYISKNFNLNEQYVKILYGGSIDSSNGPLFLNEKTIDGLLPGAASLVPNEFISIIKNKKND